MNTRKNENETVTFDEVTFERSKKKKNHKRELYKTMKFFLK